MINNKAHFALDFTATTATTTTRTHFYVHERSTGAAPITAVNHSVGGDQWENRGGCGKCANIIVCEGVCGNGSCKVMESRRLKGNRKIDVRTGILPKKPQLDILYPRFTACPNGGW